jgi:hypothetical protein
MILDTKSIIKDEFKLEGPRTTTWRHTVEIDDIRYALDFYYYRAHGGYYCNVRETYQSGRLKNLTFDSKGNHVHLPKDRVVAKFWLQPSRSASGLTKPRKIVRYLEKTYKGEPKKDWSKGWAKYAYLLSKEYQQEMKKEEE